MKKVLVGGTFNMIHPGHLFFLKKAKEKGDYLVVVVANDKTVLRRKGFLVMPAVARKKVLENLRIVDRAVIGDERDFLKVVRKERPDTIVLGYDQKAGNLEAQLEKRGIKSRVVRLKSRVAGYGTEKAIANSMAKIRKKKGAELGKKAVHPPPPKTNQGRKSEIFLF